MLTATALLWTRIIAGVCVFIAAGLIRALWQRKNEVARGKNWPATGAEIIHSEAEIPPTRISEEEPDCRVNIRYRYRVDGKDYESDRLRFGGPAAMMQEAAEALVARYLVGAKVNIHYDPKHPDHAVLEGAHQASSGLIVAILVFGSIGAVLVAHGIAGRVLTAANGVPLFLFLLPAAAFLIACMGAYGFLQIRKQEMLSASWPTIPGKITDSEVVEVRDSDNRGKVTTTYRVRIAYAYRLGSHDYHGTAQKWGWTKYFGSPDGAKALAAQYPVGRDVPVYYDPTMPATSVLEPDNRVGSYAPLIVTGAFGFGALLMLYCFIWLIK
jgi:hypothetical protein